jgi:predicted AAA+ superfamily ATPase
MQGSGQPPASKGRYVSVQMPGILPRNLAPVVTARLTEEPVVVLTGARTVGKSTLIRACAEDHGVPVFDLDDVTTRQAVAADPALFTAGLPEPICIDEFQHELVLLDAIKSELNRDLRPGRYLLTGSTRYATLPEASQSLTGRAHVMTLWPFSQGELRGVRETFLDTVLDSPSALVIPMAATTSRVEYESAVLAGGLPLAMGRHAQAARDRWYRDYIAMVIERDVLEIRRVRQRGVLPQVLRRLASQTGQVLNAADVARLVSLEQNLVGDFIQLLESVFLVHRLGAYARTAGSRVGRRPKVHVVDSGLAAYLNGITAARLARRDPAILTEFGHLLETFVVNEIIKQAGWAETAVQFSHLRSKDGQEVDLVVETDDGRVVGIEVKAAGRVVSSDFAGLRLLRSRLGDDFVSGFVLHLGGQSYTPEDRLHVVPVDRIWS